MATFHIITLGCKVNLCESAALARKLTASGWREAAGDETSDLCVVNTCAVTGKAACSPVKRCARPCDETPAPAWWLPGVTPGRPPHPCRNQRGMAVMGTGEKLSIDQAIQSQVASPPLIRCGEVKTLRTFDPMPDGEPRTAPAPFLKFRTAATPTAPTASFPAPGGPAVAFPRIRSWTS